MISNFWNFLSSPTGEMIYSYYLYVVMFYVVLGIILWYFKRKEFNFYKISSVVVFNTLNVIGILYSLAVELVRSPSKEFIGLKLIVFFNTVFIAIIIIDILITLRKHVRGNNDE